MLVCQKIENKSKFNQAIWFEQNVYRNYKRKRNELKVEFLGSQKKWAINLL